jgi:hypothetical protein
MTAEERTELEQIRAHLCVLRDGCARRAAAEEAASLAHAVEAIGAAIIGVDYELHDAARVGRRYGYMARRAG